MKALLVIITAATLLLVAWLTSAEAATCRDCAYTSGSMTLPACATAAERTNSLCPKGSSGGTGCWYQQLGCQPGYGGYTPCRECKYTIGGCSNNGGGCVPL